MKTRANISDRDIAVLQALADGATRTELAKQFNVIESKGIIATAMRRVDADSPCHAVAIALRRRIID